MPGNLINSSGKPYLRIVDGNLVQKVDKTVVGARLREYELPNKQKGEKYELVFMNWEGKIQNITFKETEYGEDCIIELEDAIITLGTAGRYFSDFACKVFSGDITKPFLFHPYSIDDGERKKTGISLQQNYEKLKNYFYDGKKNLHGFPEADKTKAIKKTYWKIYFAEVTEFLIEKLKELKFEKLKAEDDLEIFDEDVENLDPISGLPF